MGAVECLLSCRLRQGGTPSRRRDDSPSNSARVRYLTVGEAERLINACDPEFRSLVRAGLETGCRYGELIRLEVCDFNPDASTLAIRQSKSGKPRHVVLTRGGCHVLPA
jgi:integrase